MKTDVSINVIIPVYNTEKYIVKCLDSLVNQTFTDWSAVIVNDGSFDESENICLKYREMYPDKFYIYKTEHMGPGAARNYGINHCFKTAKYIYFFDSDDYLETTALENLFNAAESVGADVSICGYTVHTGSIKENISFKNGIIEKAEVCQSILQNNNIGSYVWNKLFLSSLFDDIRFPENVLYEDIAVFYKIVLKSEKIAVVSEKLYNYIRRRGSIVSTYNLKYLDDLIKATKKRNCAILDEYPQLKGVAELNELKSYIYIWNQICKGKLYLEHSECYQILDIIYAKSFLYRKLDFKHMVMAYLIKLCPRFYEKILFYSNKIVGSIKTR